jgi:Flp pilus assembly pilin Flp
MNRLGKLDSRQRGATLIEYALGVAFVCIVCLGAIGALEDNSGGRLDERGDAIGGDSEPIGVIPTGSGGSGSGGGGGGGGPTTYDADVTGMTGVASNSTSKWIAQVTITVVDTTPTPTPVQGITVSGEWTINGNPPGTTTSCVTSAAGTCVVQRTNINDNDHIVTFTIFTLTSTDSAITVNYTPGPDAHTVDCLTFPGTC